MARFTMSRAIQISPRPKLGCRCANERIQKADFSSINGLHSHVLLGAYLLVQIQA